MNPPDEFFTHLFFASSIVLILICISKHSLCRIIKVDIKWLRVPIINLEDKNTELGGRIQIQVILVGTQEISLPKFHIKNRPFFFFKISKYRIYHIISSIMESSEKNGFDSNESTVIVDNSDNSHIRSEEDMFSENIAHTIFNLVATMGVNILFQKGLEQLSGPVRIMRDN